MKEFGIASEPEAEILTQLYDKCVGCQLVARMSIATNKKGDSQTVELFDLTAAISADGAMVAFQDMPVMPNSKADGLAPLCCQHLKHDSMGQLQVVYQSTTN